jgi:hypothetical protein
MAHYPAAIWFWFPCHGTVYRLGEGSTMWTPHLHLWVSSHRLEGMLWVCYRQEEKGWALTGAGGGRGEGAAGAGLPVGGAARKAQAARVRGGEEP